ncbi:putative ribonuclease H-like domain-containing protein [Tanacetum coccineum]
MLTERGDGVACITRRRHDLRSDDVSTIVTLSEHGRPKELWKIWFFLMLYKYFEVMVLVDMTGVIRQRKGLIMHSWLSHLQVLLRGLESIEEKLEVYKANESIYLQDIKGLKFEIHMGEITIRELRKKLEIVQKEKDDIQLNVDKFKHASKSLNKLIECQIVDNCKKGLGYENYNAVPPPYTGNFMPPTPNLSFTGLDEFVNEPVVENSKAMSSEEEPKVVRKCDDAPSIEEWVLDDEEEDVSQPKIKKKTVRPSIVKKEFVKRTMVYQIEYEEIDGGYVAFRGNSKGGKIIGKGKFDGKVDEGFFVGYSLNSKAFRVFNSRTRIVEENLYIRFSESTPNVVGTQSNGFAGTKASDNAGQARKETEPVKNYILLPLWPVDTPYSQDPKSSQDDGSKPSSNDGKKVDEDSRKDSKGIVQEKEDNVNSTNNVNAASINEVNAVGGKTSIKLPFDPNMPELEDYSIFEDDEDVGAEADMHNVDTAIQVSPIPTTRIHKDHPLDQVIGDLQSATQTRRMSESLDEHGFVSTIQQRTNYKDLQNCLFACFLSQEEPKKVIHALKDPSWIEAMQEVLLQFKLQEVWALVDLPNGKSAIGTKWVFRNKKDERGIVIRNKARLVA